MSEAPDSTSQQLSSAWKADVEFCTCEGCQRRFLAPREAVAVRCPYCYSKELASIPNGLESTQPAYPPELVLRHTLTPQMLDEAIHDFTQGVPYPPEGLVPEVLRKNITPLFLPMWLVDGHASAYWQAEMGFDYQVISHQEQFDQNSNRWESREVQESRVRWEPRAGRLERRYQNLAAPAMDDSIRLEKLIGGFARESVHMYQPEHLTQDLGRAMVRLPDHTPKEAWSEASAAFQKAAEGECLQACQADKTRQFRWKAQISGLNWTLLLMPVFSTFYLDEQDRPQPVIIHGQTGKTAGARRSSMKRAARASLAFLAAGILLVLLALAVDALFPGDPSLQTLANVTALLGMAGLLGSLIPFGIAWDFNRRQEQGDVAFHARR